MTSHLAVCSQMAARHRSSLRLGRSHQLKCFYVTASLPTWNRIEMRARELIRLMTLLLDVAQRPNKCMHVKAASTITKKWPK